MLREVGPDRVLVGALPRYQHQTEKILGRDLKAPKKSGDLRKMLRKAGMAQVVDALGSAEDAEWIVFLLPGAVLAVRESAC